MFYYGAAVAGRPVYPRPEHVGPQQLVGSGSGSGSGSGVGSIGGSGSGGS